MAIQDQAEGKSSARRVEMVVRTLRHEIGDLLQSVYSAVAILQERLPSGQNLERTILSDLRGRAELCKNELDTVHDLVCPFELNLDWTDLSELSAGLVSSFTPRSSSLQVICEVPRPLKVWADAQRLAQTGTMLLISLGHAARGKVEIRGFPPDAGGMVQWVFWHDGPPAGSEQLSWLQAPFSTTRHARFGLGLALARRVVEMHGGSIVAGETPQGGCRVALSLPAGPAPP
ncbi:MAG TPA: HAMP domain-containing sensor histidine kinase [Gemmataceae bacterium]|jgi:signal transduction histidine kinase